MTTEMVDGVSLEQVSAEDRRRRRGLASAGVAVVVQTAVVRVVVVTAEAVQPVVDQLSANDSKIPVCRSL